MSLIKPFLSTEIAQKVKSVSLSSTLLTQSAFFQIHLHSPSFDIEKFHAEHVPRSCLPSEFGGVCGSVEDVHEQLSKEFMELREFLALEEKQAALELD